MVTYPIPVPIIVLYLLVVNKTIAHPVAIRASGEAIIGHDRPMFSGGTHGAQIKGPHFRSAVSVKQTHTLEFERYGYATGAIDEVSMASRRGIFVTLEEGCNSANMEWLYTSLGYFNVDTIMGSLEARWPQLTFIGFTVDGTDNTIKHKDRMLAISMSSNYQHTFVTIRETLSVLDARVEGMIIDPQPSVNGSPFTIAHQRPVDMVDHIICDLEPTYTTPDGDLTTGPRYDAATTLAYIPRNVQVSIEVGGSHSNAAFAHIPTYHGYLPLIFRSSIRQHVHICTPSYKNPSWRNGTTMTMHPDDTHSLMAPASMCACVPVYHDRPLARDDLYASLIDPTLMIISIMCGIWVELTARALQIALRTQAVRICDSVFGSRALTVCRADYLSCAISMVF